ncbi:antitoxin Xre/MbcA/ParS toxin-binding domain-containing protein [Telmatospirillum sp. J64-1]|uniref:antitoxin Xre/MbcA/ParS toxin-binding domain-containing protein n=1 Tax=Telmatospirillum sp. J64-1 TaxID=2502183 RepID=UPI00115D77F9|nr:antitoxin Xre/MbcA/ParS toxin-binding domain-containing protein [Telmatospirillum sp. J64-1]
MAAVETNRQISEPARIAKWLSLTPDPPFTEVSLARSVASGLPVQATDMLVEFFGSRQVVERIVPEATLRRARKNQKRLSPQYSERLYDLTKVIDAVGRVYGDDQDRVKAFLLRPHPLLEGEKPLDLAVTGAAGADAVLNLLARAEAGVAV